MGLKCGDVGAQPAAMRRVFVEVYGATLEVGVFAFQCLRHRGEAFVLEGHRLPALLHRAIVVPRQIARDPVERPATQKAGRVDRPLR
jgi:hypothetical protein